MPTEGGDKVAEKRKKQGAAVGGTRVLPELRTGVERQTEGKRGRKTCRKEGGGVKANWALP